MEGRYGWSSTGGGGGGNNWDLDAFVRFACGGGRVPSPPPLCGDDTFLAFLPPPPLTLAHGEIHGASGQPLPDLPQAFDGDLYAAIFRQPPPLLPPPQPAAAAAAAAAANPLLTAVATGVQLPAEDSTGGARSSRSSERSGRKVKRVKTMVKRMAANKKPPESEDPWAWRKYGQKPIKGSPHPRSYYRCSTDRACQARKHVERCLVDPDSFVVVTFTGRHNHPAPLVDTGLLHTC